MQIIYIVAEKMLRYKLWKKKERTNASTLERQKERVCICVDSTKWGENGYYAQFKGVKMGTIHILSNQELSAIMFVGGKHHP